MILFLEEHVTPKEGRSFETGKRPQKKAVEQSGLLLSLLPARFASFFTPYDVHREFDFSNGLLGTLLEAFVTLFQFPFF